jgi:hypothetical protein
MIRLMFVFLTGIMLCSLQSHAQSLIPMKYVSDDDNKLLKETDSLRYYAARGDTSNIITINEETLFYKLVNKRAKKRIVAEGGLSPLDDTYLQQGCWIAYHPNGKPQLKGCYHKGKPVGNWQEYYATGTLKSSFHYAIISDKDGINTCMSGAYTEYYPDGKVKVTGFYAADRTRKRDSVIIEDPVTGATFRKTLSKSVYSPQKTGYWEYFDETGELEKREEF